MKSAEEVGREDARGRERVASAFDASSITMAEPEETPRPRWHPIAWTPDGPGGAVLKGVTPEDAWIVRETIHTEPGGRGKAATLDTAWRSRRERNGSTETPWLVYEETRTTQAAATVESIRIEAAERAMDGQMVWWEAHEALEEAQSPPCLRCDKLALVLVIANTDGGRCVTWPIDRAYLAEGDDPRDVRLLIVGETLPPVHLIADDLYRSWEGTIGSHARARRETEQIATGLLQRPDTATA